VALQRSSPAFNSPRRLGNAKRHGGGILKIAARLSQRGAAVLTAILVGLLVGVGVTLGAGLAPLATGIRPKASRARLYNATSATFGIATGVIIGLGVSATRGAQDLGPFGIAIGAFFVEGSVFIWFLVALLRKAA
jgi:hypothetical protein